MGAVNDGETCDSYVGDGACSSERSERPVIACLPAKGPGSPQAEPLPIVSVETVLVRRSGRSRRGASKNVCCCAGTNPDE